jgi:hypothetical protein
MNRPLKDLPGFDDALKRALHEKEGRFGYDFSAVGDVVLPGLKRIDSAYSLIQLALMIGCGKFDESRRIRLVPQSKPQAANDCEVP